MYTSYSEKGWSNPFVFNKESKDFRPAKKIIKTNEPLVDEKSDAAKLIGKQLLETTRRIRDAYDTNPRLSSPENLARIKAAIAECKKVDALSPEIDYFEGHVFPSNRKAKGQQSEATNGKR